MFSHSVVSDSLRPRGLQPTRLPCPSPSPKAYSNSCHPTISSSVILFSSCLKSFPASRSFLMSQLFTSGGQSTGVSALTLVSPMNTQDRFPLGWTGWISLQSKDSQSLLQHCSSKTSILWRSAFFASLVAQLVKNLPAVQEAWVQSLGGKIPWRRELLLTPVFWPGEFHGLYSAWDHKESATPE